MKQMDIRASLPDGPSEAHHAGAACTAWIWLVLYSVAITGSLLASSWLHTQSPIVADASADAQKAK